jgi:formylglycine-generating enzyme required for sulfatase activity
MRRERYLAWTACAVCAVFVVAVLPAYSQEGKAPPASQPTREMANGLGMKFVAIQPGKFLMGTPADERDRNADEVQHEVSLTRGYWMGKTEVTQKQWVAVMGENPSLAKGDDLPVTQVSWDDVQAFLKKLNQMERAKGVVYRLPTEAEWEYGCRGGESARYCSGAKDGDLGRVGWYSDNSDRKTHEVAQKAPNAWGLHDMHGNVSEWCADLTGPYPQTAIKDPAGPSQKEASGPGWVKARVHRGGSYMESARLCRSGARNSADPAGRERDLGFRLAANR